MPAKRRKPTAPDDPMQGAMSIFALTIASDEDYASGLAHRNPKAVMKPSKNAKTAKAKRPKK